MTNSPPDPDLATWSPSEWERVGDDVRALVPISPVLPCDILSERLDRPVLLKLENLQRTGSFKVRGAAARIGRLSEAERERGVVACSSGNHGRAVAWVAGRLKVRATVCVPDWIDPVKLAAIEAAGAEPRLSGPTYDDAAREAARVAEAEGRVFIHPFDDPVVAAGQGTVALELLEQVPGMVAVVVPLSGGGLAGGMGGALRARGSEARCIAVSAGRARVMYESLRAGRPIEMEEESTLASALSGGIELENRCTFELVRRHVDEHAVVAESAIEEAVAWAFLRLHLVVEGGGAVGIAAARGGDLPLPAGSSPVVIVVSGGNLDPGRLREIVAGDRTGR